MGKSYSLLRLVLSFLMHLMTLLFLLLATYAAGVSQPKVLLFYGMEGISGVTKHREVMIGNKEYHRGRMLLTADVNAAVAGLKAGGAGTIMVADAHRSGNPAADILLDRLDPPRDVS